MAKRKLQQRLSLDALELLEDIAADGPLESADLVSDLPRDEEDPWTRERRDAAIDELIASGRVTRGESGLLRAPDDGQFAVFSVPDHELGVRVRVTTSIFTADESIDVRVTAPEESGAASELADRIVEKLRSVNRLSKPADRGSR